jgi:hypothetical protein
MDSPATLSSSVNQRLLLSVMLFKAEWIVQQPCHQVLKISVVCHAFQSRMDSTATLSSSVNQRFLLSVMLFKAEWIVQQPCHQVLKISVVCKILYEYFPTYRKSFIPFLLRAKEVNGMLILLVTIVETIL